MSDILNSDPEKDTELQKLRLDFAWKHFEFHARQRTTMFNFFVIILGVVVTGFVAAVREEGVRYFAPYIALTGMFVSVAFLFLDIRNTQLLEFSERIIYEIERRYLFLGFKSSEVGTAFSTVANGQLGTLYREKLERDPQEWGIGESRKLSRFWLWLRNRFAMHKFWIRAVVIISIVGFYCAMIVGIIVTEGVPASEPFNQTLTKQLSNLGAGIFKAFRVSSLPCIASLFLALAFGVWIAASIHLKVIDFRSRKAAQSPHNPVSN